MTEQIRKRLEAAQERVTIKIDDITAGADLIQKAFPGLKTSRGLLEYVAASLLRRGAAAQAKSALSPAKEKT